MDKSKIAKLAAKLILADGSLSIKDGDKVKLNINRLQSYKDYYKREDKYKTWIKEHHNDTFTVKMLTNSKVRCAFEENNAWTFWLGDLIKK
jgi:hypothetical protein